MAWNRRSDGSIRTIPRAQSKAIPKGVFYVVATIFVAVSGVGIWFALRPKPPMLVQRPAKKVQSVSMHSLTNKPKNTTVAEIIHKRGGFKNLTKADKAEIARIRRENAAQHVASPIPPMPGSKSGKKRVFSTFSDEVIAMVMTSGENIPPFPGTNESLEQEFIRSLKIPIVMRDDDSEEDKAAKQAVMDARAAIDEEMKKGRGFREILEEYRQKVNDNTQMQREVKAAAGEIMREEGVEAADKYVEQANKKLGTWGISEVKRPMTKEEFLAYRQKRQLEKQEKQ